MSKLFNFILLFLLMKFNCFHAEWKMIFNDDFNDDKLDDTKWSYDKTIANQIRTNNGNMIVDTNQVESRHSWDQGM